MKRIRGIIILCIVIVVVFAAIPIALLADGMVSVLEALGVFFILLVIVVVFTGLVLLGCKLIFCDNDGKGGESMAERENTTGKDDVEMMSDATLNRLLQWLTDHGHTPDEIVELLDYITGK